MLSLPSPMTRAGILAVAVVVTAAGAATGPGKSAADPNAEPLSGSAPLRCEIALRETGAVTTYEARVQALEPVTGDYAFHLVQRSGGGHSVTRQSGAFHLSAGETDVIGTARFGGAVGYVDATLRLTVNGQTLQCAPRDTI